MKDIVEQVIDWLLEIEEASYEEILNANRNLLKTPLSVSGLPANLTQRYEYLGRKYGVTWKGLQYNETDELSDAIQFLLRQVRVTMQDLGVSATEAWLDDTAFRIAGIVSDQYRDVDRVKQGVISHVLQAIETGYQTGRTAMLSQEKKDVRQKVRAFCTERDFRVLTLQQARKEGWPVDNIKWQENPDQLVKANRYSDILYLMPLVQKGKRLTKVDGYTHSFDRFLRGAEDEDVPDMDGDLHGTDSLFIEQEATDKRNPYMLWDEVEAYRATLQKDIVGVYQPFSAPQGKALPWHWNQ
jgi:hypothetical protein